jgi:hypothetical protein
VSAIYQGVRVPLTAAKIKERWRERRSVEFTLSRNGIGIGQLARDIETGRISVTRAERLQVRRQLWLAWRADQRRKRRGRKAG